MIAVVILVLADMNASPIIIQPPKNRYEVLTCYIKKEENHGLFSGAIKSLWDYYYGMR
jgi:hypothetical protein